MRPILPLSCSVVAFLALGAPAGAQCSPTNLVVTGTYSVNGQVRPILTFGEGVSYHFDATAVQGSHPLILTTHPAGGWFEGELTEAQVPGYLPGGTCMVCPQDQFTVTPGPTTPDQFYYQCFVHAGMGNMIRILRKPIITTQPEAMGVCAGQMLMVDVAASIPGGATPTYQWRKDGVNIPGQTTSMFMIDAVMAQDSGTYDCVVSNQCAKTISAEFALTVCPGDLAGGEGAGCDGGVDINDLLYFLTAFEAGSVQADLDNDGVEPQAKDGGVDINDLLYFLAHFEAGC